MNIKVKEILEKLKKCIDELYKEEGAATYDQAGEMVEELNKLLGDNDWYKELPKIEEALRQAKDGNKDALGFVSGWIGLVESKNI